MFGRRQTTPDPEANPDLPAGYDDPDSPFWVHEDLRPHYRVNPQTDVARTRSRGPLDWAQTFRAREFFEQLATEEDRAVAQGSMTNGSRQYRRDLSDGQKARLVGQDPRFVAPLEPTAEEVQAYLHHHRILDAARTLEQLQADETKQAVYTATHTCAGCHQVEPTTTSRTLGQRRLLVCQSCATVADRHLVDALAAELVGDRTRADLIAELLDTAPVLTMADLIAAQPPR